MNAHAPALPVRWLTEQELADLLRISLRHVMLGAVVCYDLPEVLAHLKTHRHLASRNNARTDADGKDRP